MIKTWLESSITNSQIFPPDYKMYRKNREGNTTGRGFHFDIQGKLLSTDIPELDTDCEII